VEGSAGDLRLDEAGERLRAIEERAARARDHLSQRLRALEGALEGAP